MVLERNGKSTGFIFSLYSFQEWAVFGPPFPMVVIMANIIRATTPTIKYTFKHVNVEDITVAYMTIMMGQEVVVEKDLVQATVEEDALSWTLTQQETLSMTGCRVSVMLNWKLSDGTRGASARTTLFMESNDKDEVI